MMKSVFAMLLTPLAWGQCPNTPSPHFSCTSAGGNTQITLFADAELSWDRFDLPHGGSLEIASMGGEGFASRHLTPGNFPSTIAGGIVADGPFTLVNSAGIRMTSSGSLVAPGIVLSTLPVTESGDFIGNPRAGQMILSGNLDAPSGDLTLLSFQLSNDGVLRAPEGKVTVIATGAEVVSGPDLQRHPNGDSSESQARVTNRGVIGSPVIEIYSEGFLQNGGRLEGRQITLDGKRGVLHENSEGSVIVTDDLILPSGGLIQGPVVGPNDGNNPGGVSTTLGLPDLEKGTFSSGRKTTLLPTQFSASNVSRARVPSAVSRKKKSASGSLATRGSKPKKKSVKKRSFFGTVTTR